MAVEGVKTLQQAMEKFGTQISEGMKAKGVNIINASGQDVEFFAYRGDDSVYFVSASKGKVAHGYCGHFTSGGDNIRILVNDKTENQTNLPFHSVYK